MDGLQGGQGFDAHFLDLLRSGWHELSRTLSEACASLELPWRLILVIVLHGASPNAATYLYGWQWLPRRYLLLLKPEQLVLLSHSLRQRHDVLLGCSAYVRNGILHDLDAALTIIGNDIATDVRLAVLPEDDNAVKGALLDFVAPDKRHRSGFIVVTYDLDAVFVRFGDRVIKQLGLIVLDLDADTADLYLVLDDVGIHV